MDPSSDASGARLLDMALEDGAPRAPLSGLFPNDLPLPSLEDALVPIAAASQLSHLHPTTGRSVKIARKQAKRAQAKHPSLTLDECTAIVLYTIEEFPRENSLYYALNLALRNQLRKAVRPWRDYIWLLLHALRKLPPATATTVYRGCRKSPDELGLELTAGFDFTWASFSSTATTQGVMNTFVGQSGPRTLMTIELVEASGREVNAFSLFPGENEILFPPNMCFEVVDSFDAGNELIMVQCKQTETIDSIMDHISIPFSKLSVAPAAQAPARKPPPVLATDGTDITELVALVRDGNDAQKEEAAGALRNFAHSCDDNKIAIAKAGGIPPLVALVWAMDGYGYPLKDGQQEAAAYALEKLAKPIGERHRVNRVDRDNQFLIAEAGGIPPLVALVRDGNEAQKKRATYALSNFAYEHPNKRGNKILIPTLSAIKERKNWGLHLAENHAQNEYRVAIEEACDAKTFH